MSTTWFDDVFGECLDAGTWFDPDLTWKPEGREQDGLHGGELDHFSGLAHRGFRHATLGDGRWLQPEPLLMLPLVDGLDVPAALGPVYAKAAPTFLQDVAGLRADRLESFHTDPQALHPQARVPAVA